MFGEPHRQRRAECVAGANRVHYLNIKCGQSHVGSLGFCDGTEPPQGDHGQPTAISQRVRCLAGTLDRIASRPGKRLRLDFVRNDDP